MAICPIIWSFYYLARALMHHVACEFAYAVGCAETISANVLKRALGLTLTQSTTLLIKAKFSYSDQIKFNEPVLKLETPEWQHITKQWLFTSFSWKTSCYLSKTLLKSNFYHVPTDGVVRAQNKREIHNFLLTGEVTGKNVTGMATPDFLCGFQ